MGYAIYRVGDRWAGYGVPAVCEHPDCDTEIDRGMSYACGGEPFSEHGCDRYFCEKHLLLHSFNVGGGRECVQVCQRCAKHQNPFPYKKEHKDWINHLLTDESWKEWRQNNPQEVAKLKKLIWRSQKKSKTNSPRSCTRQSTQRSIP